LIGQQHLSNELIQSFPVESVQDHHPEGQVSAAISRPTHDAESESTSRLSDSTPHTLSMPVKADTVEIRTSCAGSRNRSCNKWCSCVCHKHNYLKLSTPLDYVLGSLFVGYSGLPISTPACSEHSCLRRAIPSMELSYYFPRWFLARSIFMSLKVVPLVGPELTLRTPRLIRWTSKEANLFHLAMAGNIRGIQSMFSDGTATPFDVTLSSGKSALFVSRP
jgi:hypothetical protein